MKVIATSLETGVIGQALISQEVKDRAFSHAKKYLEMAPQYLPHNRIDEYRRSESWNHYRVNLEGDNYKMLSHVLGIKRGQYIIVQKGDNATTAKPVLIEELHKVYHNGNMRILNASELHTYEKTKVSNREKGNKLTKTAGHAFIQNEDGTYSTEAEFSLIEMRSDSKREVVEYLDTTKKNIKRIPAFVIDIDNHSDIELMPVEYKRVADALVYFLLEDAGILCHAINYTGRGLQVFFSVNAYDPNHKKIAKFASDVYAKLKKVVSEVLSYADSTKLMSVDMVTSPSRQMFRMPGTVNSKNGEVCKTIYFNDDYERYDFNSLNEACNSFLNIKPSGKTWNPNLKKEIKAKKKKNKNASTYMENKKAFLNNRLADLITFVREMRTGVRHKTFMAIYVTMRSNNIDHNDAINFIANLDAKENLNYFKGKTKVENVAKHYEGYYDRMVNDKGEVRFTNEKMMQFVGISEKDVEELGLTSFTKGGNKELIRERKRNEKKERREEILNFIANKLAKEKTTLENLNISKLAKELGIARTTLRDLIKKASDSIIKSVKEKTKALKQKVEEILSKKKKITSHDIPEGAANLNERKDITPNVGPMKKPISSYVRKIRYGPPVLSLLLPYKTLIRQNPPPLF